MSPLRQAHWMGRGGLAFMFAYHGLVPKLIALSPTELLLLRAHGLDDLLWLTRGAGIAELALAALLLFAPRKNWPLAIAAVVLIGLLVDVALVQPSLLVDAFNPVSLNIAGLALCAVAWVTRFANDLDNYKAATP